MDITIKEEAEMYQPQQTKNISELKEVSVDLMLEDDEFEFEDIKTGKMKTIKQRVLILNGQKYRMPVSVLKQLKVHLEENPHLDKFKVKKTGTGLDTEYTLIPL